MITTMTKRQSFVISTRLRPYQRANNDLFTFLIVSLKSSSSFPSIYIGHLYFLIKFAPLFGKSHSFQNISYSCPLSRMSAPRYGMVHLACPPPSRATLLSFPAWRATKESTIHQNVRTSILLNINSYWRIVLVLPKVQFTLCHGCIYCTRLQFVPKGLPKVLHLRRS